MGTWHFLYKKRKTGDGSPVFSILESSGNSEKLTYYDGAGNVIKEKQFISKTDGVKEYSETEYEYDSMNRVTCVKANDGERDIYTQYAYNKKGLPTMVEKTRGRFSCLDKK